MRVSVVFIYICAIFPLILHLTLCEDPTETTEDTEYVEVNKLSGDIRIYRRSTRTDFPQNFIFHFEMSTGNVTLDLERSVKPRVATPVYIIENGNVTKHRDISQDTFGVYQDPALGASALVKCPFTTTTHCEIFGSFTHGDQHYQIEPVKPFYRKRRSVEEMKSEEVHSGSVTHRIRRYVNPYADFAGDELMPPQESSGLNRGFEIPPYPGAVRNLDDNDVPIVQLQMTKPADRVVETTTDQYQSDILIPHTFSSRNKRATETLYIEYMVVVDYKNLERWKLKVGGASEEERVDNAFEAMHEYYQFVVNGIDVRFRTATGDGPEIRVNFVTLLVSTEEKTSPWIQNNMLGTDSIDDAGVLLDFATWRNSVIQYLPSHDHAGLYTGFDIATPTSRNPIGMGYLNSVCHNSWAVSEVEETYNAVAIHIGAHELGHNIGTRHDGNQNSCASSSLYLMAPRLPFIYNADMRSNPWKFSSCSQAAIKSFIAGLGSNNCLTNTPSVSSLKEDLPGLKYSADQQCNNTYGNDAVLCRDELYYQWDSICYAMQCKKTGDNSCTGRFFPFDGTPCGDKKWCQSGECLFSEDAPSYDEKCLFGDDPNVDCTSPDACDERDLYSSKVRCCRTCSTTTSSSSTTLSTSSTTSTTPSTTTSTSSTTSSTPTTTSSTPSTTSSTPSTTSSTPSTTTSTSSTTSTTLSTTSSTMSTDSSTTSTTSPTSITTSTTLSTSSSTSSTTSSTMSTTTSTKSGPSSTTSNPGTTITVNHPIELDFDLQTMVSLFVSSALVI